ncbi:MAG TPA: YceI family protein [Blastocatellia bacterium]|nr:YceI family protein [Blastocatellia bacterium]
MKYRITPVQSARFGLVVTKTGLLRGKKHLFLFDRYEGEFSHDPDGPAGAENTTVYFTLSPSNIVCEDTWVNASDRKKILATTLHDMLAVDRYPDLVFRSEKITVRAEREYEVWGQLTVRGIDKPARVKVSLTNEPAGYIRLDGAAVLRLTDYGLTPPSALLGAIGTRDQIEVSFRLVAQPDQAT